MAGPTTRPDAVRPEAEAGVALFDGRFGPIEAASRDRARASVETTISGELDAAPARVRHARRPAAGEGGDGAAAGAVGYRHGRRTRTLPGTFGTAEATAPRARPVAGDGGTGERRSEALGSRQRRTEAADAPIAGACLAGTSTRRVRRALAAPFGEAVGKDVVGRTWREVGSARNGRDLAAGAVARLVLDGTVARVRPDRKATSVPLPVAPGVRRDGQKVPLAVETVGGESGAARRASPDDLVTRGLRPPGLITVDGAPGLEKALAALRPAVPARRCTVHQHRNLPAHAPDKPREEISADCQDMVHAAAAKGIGQRRKALAREWRLECRAAADSLGEAGGRLFTFTRPPISRWRSAR